MQDILSVESDLIDEYVRGEIPRHHRERFEKHFHWLPPKDAAKSNLRKRWPRSLLECTRNDAERDEVRIPGAQEHLLGFSLRPSSSAGALNGSCIAGGNNRRSLAHNRGLRVRSQLNQLRANQQSRRTLNGESSNSKSLENARATRISRRSSIGNETPSLNARLSVKPRSRPILSAPTRLLRLILMPGLARGGNSRAKLTISPSVRSVRMSVGVEPQDSYSSFRVELLTQTGQKIWSQDKLSMHKTAGRRRDRF